MTRPPCQTCPYRSTMNGADLLSNLPPYLRAVLDDTRALASDLRVEVYLVGGPVRDLLLGREVVDVDISVVGDGVAFAGGLAERAGGAVVAESQFRTAKVELADTAIDVASTRLERYQLPGSLPSVDPGTILDDLARRDFTVNAMAVALHDGEFGLLLDPHAGRADLDARLLRVLHEASFQDDATRTLRGVGYATRLGFHFEPKTEALLRRDADMLGTISGDRLRNALFRLLQEPGPARCLHLAGDLGLLGAILPALADHEAIAANMAKLGAQGAEPALLSAAMAWGLRPEDAKMLASRLSLRLSEAEPLEHVAGFQSVRLALRKGNLRPSEVVRLLDGLSVEALQVAAVLERNARVTKLVRTYLADWRHVQSVLNGGDLRRLGIAPGPRIGELLRGLRNAHLNGEASTREDAERWVRSRM